MARTRYMHLLHPLLQLTRTLLTLLYDGACFLGLCLRPSPTLAAENLFLRRQLAIEDRSQVSCGSIPQVMAAFRNTTVLDQQFVRLTALEKEILLYLASAQQPTLFRDLCDTLHQSPLKPTLLEAVRALQRRSLLTTSAEGLSLPNVVAAYIAHYVHETRD